MSIYSGFATRELQATYNHSLYNLVLFLQSRLLHVLQDRPVDKPHLLRVVKKFHKHFHKLQKQKYLEPKFAPLLLNFLDDVVNPSQAPKEFSQMSVPSEEQPASLSGLDNMSLQVQKDTGIFKKVEHQMRRFQKNSDLDLPLIAQEKTQKKNKNKIKRRAKSNLKEAYLLQQQQEKPKSRGGSVEKMLRTQIEKTEQMLVSKNKLFRRRAFMK